MVETPPRHNAAAFVLWSAGCALCVMVLSAALAGFHPVESVVNPKGVVALFFVLGFVFPAIAFALAANGVPERLRTAVAVCAVILAGLYFTVARQYGVVPFAVLELVAAWPLLRRMTREGEHAGWVMCSIAVLTLGGWNVAVTLAHGMSFIDLLLGRTSYAPGPGVAIALVLATLLGTLTLAWPQAERQSRLVRGADVLAVIFFAIASWRRNMPLAIDDHHVSFFVGPVEAVRQGHWLLWDVPSQYGVLNFWLIGHLPAPNGYEAFVYANTVLIFCAALIAYAVARIWAKAAWSALFCAATLVAADFFVGGIWFARLGAEQYPSAGAMRFIWCYVLVGLLAIGYSRGWLRRAPNRVLIAGSLAWIAACWWSAEAGIFATVIWLPAAVALMWVRGVPALQMLRNAGAAAGGLVITAVLVELVYLIGLGHAPDWRSFVEFGLLYEADATPLTTFGGVWLLVSTFAVTVALVLYCWHAAKREALPVLVGAAAAQWATMSLFVVRPADNDVDNLIPIQLLTLFAAIAVIHREKIPLAIGGALRLFVVPIAAVTFALGWWSWPFVPQAGYFFRGPGNWGAVARRIPPQVQQMLARHDLGPGAPVLYLGSSILRLLPPQWPGDPTLPHLWTPGLPSLLIAQLPLDRQIQYVSRFAAREPGGGYTVTDASVPPITPDFLPALRAVYTSSVVDREGPYVLTRYQRRP